MIKVVKTHPRRIQEHAKPINRTVDKSKRQQTEKSIYILKHWHTETFQQLLLNRDVDNTETFQQL